MRRSALAGNTRQRVARRHVLAAALAGGAVLLANPAATQTVRHGSDWANLARYRADNARVRTAPADARRVVMMGDSITEAWPQHAGRMFAERGLVGRGISGQTTAQMLVRFWPDVVALAPKAVHILAGINDIAENLDPYDAGATQNNLAAMALLAKGNGIRVIMASVLPASAFAWRPALGNPMPRVASLNAWLRTLCAANDYIYADYGPRLQGTDGGLQTELGPDGVHPNAAGYAAMGPVALAAITQALNA